MQPQVKKRNILRRGLSYGGRIPSRFSHMLMRNMVGSVTGVHTKKRVIAFSFDDGPHPEYTPQLVDVLNKYNAKATFFMVGENAARYPDVVTYAGRSGHAIGNHTWNHPAVPAIARRERLQQMIECEKVLSPYGMKLFRPPYGFQSIRSYLDARYLGYQIVAWTQTVQDWLDHSVERLVDNLTKALKPGSIILMHDVLYHTIEDRYADRYPLIHAIDSFLEQHSDQYTFVTVPELFRYGRIKKDPWFKKADISWLNALNNCNARQYKENGSRKK